MKLNKYFKKVSSKSNDLVTYYFLIAVRVLLVFVPQIGYIHPDEFFQSSEIMAGDALDVEYHKTWEFNTSSPIRSVLLPYVLVKLPLVLCKIVFTYLKHFLYIDLYTSYTILIIPRLIMCALSFINDLSLYKICSSYGIQYETRLVALGSSFVMLVFSSRTFSNTIEMALVSILLYYVSECMILSNTVIYQTEVLQEKYEKAQTPVDRVRIFKMKWALPEHSFNKCFIISTLCVAGCFNRPTFLFFGLPLVFYWFHRGMGSKIVSFLDFNLRIGLFLVSAIPALIVFVMVDSLYYGYLTTAEIDYKDVSINNFVLTPWNFVKYNINGTNTAEHGIHPKYLHLLVNIPLLFNVLGCVTIVSTLFVTYRFFIGDYKNMPRAQSVIGLMMATICTPTIILSLINHQEPRFLIPLTLPIILLHGAKLKYGFCTMNPFRAQNAITNFIYNKFLSSKASSKSLLKLWFTVNMFMTFFFGFLHQGGVFQLTEHFSGFMKQKSNQIVPVHLVTSHIYSIPESLLLIPSSEILHVNKYNGQKYRKTKMFHVHELGGMDMHNLYRMLKIILHKNPKGINLFLAIPSSLSEDLNLEFYKSNSTRMHHDLVKVFYPHLSVEAMPRLNIQHPCEVNTDVTELDDTCGLWDMDNSDPLTVNYVLRQFSSIIHQFGLNLYKIKLNKKSETF